MNTHQINKGLLSLEQGLQDVPLENLAYKILIADLTKIQSTWNSIQLANVLNSPNFSPLTTVGSSTRLTCKGPKTPTHLFYYPIALFLLNNGNTAHIKDIYKYVEDNHIFTNEDLAAVGKGKQEPRWKVTLRWAKEELIAKGILDRNPYKGVWSLSDAGTKWLNRNIVKGL